MSVLQALVNAYDRMADRKEVPPFGYSSEKIGFVIVLDEQGATVGKFTYLPHSSGRARHRGRFSYGTKPLTLWRSPHLPIRMPARALQPSYPAIATRWQGRTIPACWPFCVSSNRGGPSNSPSGNGRTR